MTRAHRRQVLERAPSVEKRVYLLREFADVPDIFQTELDIPDPMGQAHKGYKECFLIIENCVNKVAGLI